MKNLEFHDIYPIESHLVFDYSMNNYTIYPHRPLVEVDTIRPPNSNR